MERRIFRTALLISGLLLSESGCEIQESHLGSGTALDFSLELVNGEWFDAAELYGSVVLLNFWDTNCGACEQEQADLNRLHRELNRRGFELLGVTHAWDGRNATERYLRDHDVPYPCGYFGADVVRAFGNITVLPTTILIDRAGMIDTTITGQRTYDALAALIAPLLEN